MAKLKNRIVSTAQIDPTTIEKNPANWRTHPEYQRRALEGVLEDVGWVQDVIINETTGRLVDGHLRVDVAVARGEKTIPVKYVKLTEEEERLVLATIDPIGELAARDELLFRELLAGTDSGNDAVSELLAELSAPFGAGDHGKAPPPEFPEHKPPRFNLTCPKCGFGWTGKTEETEPSENSET